MGRWGDCLNTFSTEANQLVYARRVGLASFEHEGLWPVTELAGARVLDLSGGPASFLLKCRGHAPSLVLEPDPMPRWVHDRYTAAGVSVLRAPIDRYMPSSPYDEVWIFDLLRHAPDPEAAALRAVQCGHTIRAFEWLDGPEGTGRFTEDDLTGWIGEGTLEEMGTGTAWYTVVPGIPPTVELS